MTMKATLPWLPNRFPYPHNSAVTLRCKCYCGTGGLTGRLANPARVFWEEDMARILWLDFGIASIERGILKTTDDSGGTAGARLGRFCVSEPAKECALRHDRRNSI